MAVVGIGIGATIRRPDSFTKLHLRMNGEGNVFRDLTGKTITAYGNANQNYNNPYFIGKIAYFDGNGDYISISDSTDFDLTSSGWTFETWFQTVFTGDQYIYSKGGGGIDWNKTNGHYIDIWLNSGTSIVFDISNSGTAQRLEASATYNDGKRHHLACVWTGTYKYIFLDGLLIASVAFTSPVTPTYRNVNVIGATSNVPNGPFDGYLSEVRISNVARYTSSFIPPTRRK